MNTGLKYILCLPAVLLWTAAAYTLQAQGLAKPSVTPQEYPLWGILNPLALSSDGRYVGFSMHYQDRADTLFIRDSKSDKLWRFANASKGDFINATHFIFKDSRNTLHILDLTKQAIATVPDVQSYTPACKTGAVLFTKLVKGKSELWTQWLTTGIQHCRKDVTQYACDGSSANLVYSKNEPDGSEVFYKSLERNTTPEIIVGKIQGTFSHFTWGDKSSCITFLHTLQVKDEIQRRLYFHDRKTKENYIFEAEKHPGFPAGWQISPQSVPNFRVSPDGLRVFFKIIPAERIPTDNNNVQIWNAADKYLYPVQRDQQGNVKPERLAVWWPQSGKFEFITDSRFSDAFLVDNDNLAILSDPSQYEPQWRYDAPRDYYLYDFKNGTKDLVLQEQPYDWENLTLSPNTLYLSYFREGNWWVFDISRRRHINISAAIPSDFARDDLDIPFGTVPYGKAGWDASGHTILIYDKYDIWSVDVQSLNAKRVTHGREQKCVYRLATVKGRNTTNYDGTSDVPLPQKIPLQVTGNGQTGYCILDHDRSSYWLSMEDKKINNIMLAPDGKTLLYMQQDYDRPPSLIIRRKQGLKEIFQSNRHHYNYDWGKSELISYRNSKGALLNAALYYPCGYNPEKAYPMIVHVYDRQSQKFRDYVNPSLYNTYGFNITNLTANGYFVLVPDVVFEIGNPGYAAADCVVSATQHVVSAGYADKERIGLIGHSFGGYETDFIITQTDIFKAAVSGAAITDLPSSYLYTSWNYARPNFWHYEYYQLRMGQSLFDNFAGYLSNSPIYHAARVRTPLLSWAGEEDRQVHYYQSMAFYLAMRRLGKPHIMLLYPGQRHVLTDKKYQEDLTIKVGQWFDYYLKDGSLPDWARPDLPR